MSDACILLLHSFSIFCRVEAQTKDEDYKENYEILLILLMHHYKAHIVHNERVLSVYNKNQGNIIKSLFCLSELDLKNAFMRFLIPTL